VLHVAGKSAGQLGPQEEKLQIHVQNDVPSDIAWRRSWRRYILVPGIENFPPEAWTPKTATEADP
jgi:hypothetical protein